MIVIRLYGFYRSISMMEDGLLHSPFSSFLGPDIRLRILFSNTLSNNDRPTENKHTTVGWDDGG